MMQDEWLAANRANWDERVPIHLAATDFYDLAALRAGHGRLDPIVERELGDVAGQRVLHLQCHFGRDSLILAQRGADIVGLDFSGVAIAAARALADELGLAGRARFIEADLYAAREAIAEPASFDRIFVTWGALYWLPDIAEWARIVAYFLKPGGSLYLAEGHPFALVFSTAGTAAGMPGWDLPYFATGPQEYASGADYADDSARLANARTFEWMHGIGAVTEALVGAGLRLDWFREHARVPWRMFPMLVRAEDGLYGWPDKPWLPLAYSLGASAGTWGRGRAGRGTAGRPFSRRSR